jgi:hypothetical protein
MLVENAIKRILLVPRSWARVEQVNNIQGGLELYGSRGYLGFHLGRSGSVPSKERER